MIKNQDNKLYLFFQQILIMNDSETPQHNEYRQPEHYRLMVDPLDIMKLDFTKEEYRAFLVGNILKYILRYNKKDGLKDLRKASVYIHLLIDDWLEEEGDPSKEQVNISLETNN